MSTTKSPTAFTDTLADILRLPDETLAMSYIYLNKYLRFQSSASEPDPLDAYTLSLASLSLASKATECPRRLSSILLPAHALLHPPSTYLPTHNPNHPPPIQGSANNSSNNPLSKPLKIPSTEYDALRATLVQAELLLLRVLGFELRAASPMEWVGRYLERAMEEVEVGEGYERWGEEERAEFGVREGGWLEGTGLGRWVVSAGVGACKNYNISNFFPARAVALGCVYAALRERGLGINEKLPRWVDRVGSGKVDVEDFEEVLVELGKS